MQQPVKAKEMSAAGYLKEKLEFLSEKFPSITFKYAFDNTIQTHIVEITPETEYYYNKTLDKAWIPISLEFMKLFKDDTISFISSDSILAITVPELIYSGFSTIHGGELVFK